MSLYVNLLLTELCALVADLGKGGGSISPSVYDTAQVIRLCPPQEGVEPALAWLQDQQKADGGWGEVDAPYARAVPTLASILALRTYEQDAQTSAAIKAGLDFLHGQADLWQAVPIDQLPIAAEMVFPYLLEEADQARLALSREPYALLYKVREHKRKLLAGMPLAIGSPPTHSWEALGKSVSSVNPDPSGGIGHSPAATAAWLRQAAEQPARTEHCAIAHRYLINAAAATGVGVPGVVPNVWPITGFELAYAPYALLVTGLFQHSAVRTAIEPILDELWIIMQRGHGVSFGEYFTPDADDTGLAMAVLQATGRPVDSAAVLQFKTGDHFCTFHYELNPSIFANAHALQGLAYTGERYPAAEEFLCKHQGDDGRWLADKLHSSWLYTTLEVVLTLHYLGYVPQVEKAINGLLHHQKPDGGWGSGQRSSRLETSYALITLATLKAHNMLSAAAESALLRGYKWLTAHEQSSMTEHFWIGKELYSPYRVDRIYELSALLSVTMEKIVV